MDKRESDPRFSTSGFFHESVSPGALEYFIRAISNFCTKIRGDIRNFVFITGVNDTGDKLFTGATNTGEKLSLVPFFYHR
jgi:hypothetical protein